MSMKAVPTKMVGFLATRDLTVVPLETKTRATSVIFAIFSTYNVSGDALFWHTIPFYGVHLLLHCDSLYIIELYMTLDAEEESFDTVTCYMFLCYKITV